MTWDHFINSRINSATSTLKGSIVQDRQEIQLCYSDCYGFNKCLQAIFSQLSFENFWLYLLSARLFWLKIIKNYYKSLLKVCELSSLRSELSSHQMYSKMLRLFSSVNIFRSLISVSSESSKIHLLIKVLYRHIWFNLCRRYFLFHALNVSLCY